MKTMELFETVSFDRTEEDDRMDTVVLALEKSGQRVSRYDPVGSPKAFRENTMVDELLADAGKSVLPITLIDGVLMKQGGYPTNLEIMKWFPQITETVLKCCSGTGKGCGGCCHEA